ncbi:hypothetical protein MTO96_044500 [Rhipicephalus appendiculatus]
MNFSTRIQYILVLLIAFEASRICMTVHSTHSTGGQGDDVSCNQTEATKTVVKEGKAPTIKAKPASAKTAKALGNAPE